MKMEVAKLNPEEMNQQILCHKLVIVIIVVHFVTKGFLKHDGGAFMDKMLDAGFWMLSLKKEVMLILSTIKHSVSGG